MTNGKRMAASLAVALGLAAMAAAQPPRDRPSPPQGGPGVPPGPGGLERVLQDLRLEPAQREKMQEILRAHHDKMRKIAEQARQDLLKQLKGVLNEEQFNRIKEQLERMPPSPPRPPDGRRPEGREGPGDRPRGPGDRPRRPAEAGDGDRPRGPGDRDRPAPRGPREGGERRGRPEAEGRRGPGGPGGVERLLADLKLSDEQKEKAREVLRANRERLLKDMKEVLDDKQYNQFKERLENRRPGGPPPGRRDRDENRRERRDNP